MKVLHTARPADHVRPKLTEARVERMWAVVEQAQQRRVAERPALRWAMVGSLAAAACILLVVLLRSWAPIAGGDRAVARGDTFATDTGGRHVTLPDGSLLAMGHATRLEVVRITDDEVRLRLERGVLTCDVPRLDKRRFVVEAGGTEIAVMGTRFSVELAPGAEAGPELSVSVERGLVQVRRDEQTVMATLGPGQTWASQKPAEPAASAQTAASVPSPETPPLLGARELMDRANAARVAGRPADAAREYARLSERFPGDARAGLAAFELGRIRLTSLNDPRGALEAFRFALSHQRGGFFAEDAEAGIVESLHRIGDTGACAEARDAFLERHAQSPHVRRLRPMCTSR
jgi:hypothetical protein